MDTHGKKRIKVPACPGTGRWVKACYGKGGPHETRGTMRQPASDAAREAPQKSTFLEPRVMLAAVTMCVYIIYFFT